MKTNQQALRELRISNFKRKREAMQLRYANLRRKANVAEREAKDLADYVSSNQADDLEHHIDSLENYAEELRTKAANVRHDYEERQDEAYFRSIDPYHNERTNTVVVWVEDDAENSDHLAVVGKESGERIRTKS